MLLNVALYAVVRVKMLVDGSLDTQLAGYLMMGFGMLSFLVAGLFLHRQRDIKRMFSYSSIEHMGLMTFAFGLGGPLATFGALLHMTVHSLTKSAIFVTVGHATHIAGTQAIEKIRGLIQTQPTVGWGLVIGTAAIAGFPPFGVFTSEFLLLTATMKSWPWLTLPLLSGLGIAFAGLFRHLQPMVFGRCPAGSSGGARQHVTGRHSPRPGAVAGLGDPGISRTLVRPGYEVDFREFAAVIMVVNEKAAEDAEDAERSHAVSCCISASLCVSALSAFIRTDDKVD